MKKKTAFEHLWDSYSEIGSPGRVMVAISGGSDSVALLILLCKLREERCLELSAIHINHGLRASSADEEIFVEKLCEEWKVPLKVRRVKVEAGNTEAKAREARYEAFFASAKEDKCGVIALAHHAGDQAETVLMRLVRGCGDGLSAMDPFRIFDNGIAIWRPLLPVLPEELKRINTENGTDWCEDESNRDKRYLRNYLRNTVLTGLEDRCINTRINIVRSAQIIKDNTEYIKTQANAFLKAFARSEPIPSIEFTAYTGLHIALRRAVIRMFTDSISEEIPFGIEKEVCELKHGGRVNIPGDHHLERYGNRVYLVPPERKKHPKGKIITAISSGCITGDGVYFQAAPEEILEGTVLRFREAGDRIQPFGCKGTKLLSDYMTDRKIPTPERDCIPLLCSGKEVLWVIGYGVSEKLRVDAHAEKVMMTYVPE